MKFDFLSFVGKHSKITLAFILVVTVFFGYHATHLQLDADYVTLMNENETPALYQGGDGPYIPTEQNSSIIEDEAIPETMQLETSMLAEHLIADISGDLPEKEPPYTTRYLVLVESDRLFEADSLNMISRVMEEMDGTDYLGNKFSILDFVTLEKKGTRLMSVPFASQGEWDAADAELLRQRIEQDPIVKDYLVSEDLNGMLFSFDSLALTPEQESELSAMLDPLRNEGMGVHINGGAVITNLLIKYLSRDLSMLLSLCFIAILIVYYLSFRAKRSVLLPFSMSVIGIIWTFGTMRLLGYSLTIVNIVTPCMVLNLGSSYAIHVIGEYYTDYAKGLNSIESTKKILRTIFFACLTTVIGFLSLLFSQTPALREFGIAVGIGVTYCAILASTYLPAQLSLVVPPKKAQIRTYKKGYLARLVVIIDNLVKRKYVLFILLWLVVIAGYGLTKDHIPINTNYMSYLPKKDTFAQSSRYFAQKMGGDTPYTITIDAPEGAEQFFLQSENLSQVYAFEEAIRSELPDVRQILSFASYVSFANQVYSGEEGIPSSRGLLNLINRMIILMSNQNDENLGAILNPEGTKLTIFLQNYDSVDQDLMTISSSTRIEEGVKRLLPLLPNGTQVTLGGEPHKVIHFSSTLLSDQKKSTYASYILVFLVVFVAFKSLSLAFYALIPILTGVMANYVFMYFFNIPFDMITVSFAAVAVGAGIDDAIHFLIRYKNKLAEEKLSVENMLSETIKETGRPIILTTLSIVAGMMMFLFASYTPVRYFGSLMSIALLNCMFATLVVMPSVITLTTRIKRHFTH